MIKENPFYILDATTRDNRQKIVELAEEKSFDIDEDLCQKARADLTMPRNRVFAELNWFPGVSPRKVTILVTQLKSIDKDLYSIEGIPDLARINIFMELLNIEDFKLNNEELEKIILNIIYDFENLDIEKTIRDINEDRMVSGFPEVNDYELVQNYLIEKKRNCIKLILKCLNNLDTKHLIDIMTRIVDDETANGEIQASSMIEDLVDDYKLHSQSFLEQEFEKIKTLIELIRDRADEGEDSIFPLIDRLLTMTKQWDDVAQPIQLSMKSRGLDEPLSNNVAKQIRSLGIDLYNGYGYLVISKKISEVLKELFAELPEILEIVENDIDTLGDLIYKKQKHEDEEEEFKKSLNYSVEIGILFKDLLTINYEGITWKNRTYPLNKISKISWGAVSNSINGIPTGTTYTITFGDKNNTSSIETKRSTVFTEVVDKLWKTAGVQIIQTMIEFFKNGDGKIFNNATIWDDGISIIKKGGWFTADEKKKFYWKDVNLYSSNGQLIIQSTLDKDFYVAIGYQDFFNVHFLEQLIRMKLKNPQLKKISELFEN